MNKTEFDEAFRGMVSRRLTPHGFVLNGETLVRSGPLDTITLHRLGGRMSWQGAATYVLCFRHNILRDRSEQVPRKVPKEVFDYPFKFKPSELYSTPETRWRYVPRNGSYDYDRLYWADQPTPIVLNSLERLGEFIEARFLPWTASVTPLRAAEMISTDGENAWIERLWLEDYSRLTV